MDTSSQTNIKITNALEREYNTLLKSLKSKSIRDSLEDYRKETISDTKKLTDKKDKEHNMAFIHSFYSGGLDALEENEGAFEDVFQQVIKHIETLDKQNIIDDFITQLTSQIPKLKLRPEYSSLYALFFEYSLSSQIQGIAFPKQQLIIAIEEPLQIVFENGSYASDFAIDLDAKEIFNPLLSDEYEEVIWAFENELNCFAEMNKLYLIYFSICLKDSLSSLKLKPLFNQYYFDENALFYSNVHDGKSRTIYIRE